MKNKKIIIMWILLILLIFLVLVLSYFKFFGSENPNIEEKPIENSSSTAIIGALAEITRLFNQNDDINLYQKENVNLKAITNQYSIYIHYSINDETTTYEFDYSNLKLSIRVDNNKENIEKFKIIYKILIESCQLRMGNSIDIGDKIDDILIGKIQVEGISRIEEEKTIYYQLDITKKITEGIL